MNQPHSTQNDAMSSPRQTAVSVPATLCSDGTKLVYMYVHVTGGSTIEELKQSLEMKTISLFPVLKTLERRGFVTREDNHYLPNTD